MKSLHKDSCVAIVGCGGLGSNCANNLVRAGFLNLVLIDFDVVCQANLNRQFFFCDQVGFPKVDALADNLFRVNPNINIRIVGEAITKENIDSYLHNCDAICECVDIPNTKRLIVEYALCHSKIVIAASGICGYTSDAKVTTRKVSETCFVVGDFMTDTRKGDSPVAPKVSIVSALQAEILIKNSSDNL